MSTIIKILSIIGLLLLVAVFALMLVLGQTEQCEPRNQDLSFESSMKAISYRCYGGPEVLEYGDVEMPSMQAKQVKVAVKAAAVNPLDWHFMRGSPYIMRLMSGIGAPKEQSFGRDYSGVVEEVGSQVTKFKVGDAVFGGADGAFAEYVVVDEDRSIAKHPANATHEQMAAMPIAAISALQALRDTGELSAGDKVLINGASGGVGTFAVQIAKSMGATVAGVCSTRNVELVKSLGADRVFDYKQEDFVESEEKYDLIVDNVGNRTISELRRVLKEDGIVVMIGGPSGNWIGPFENSLKAMLMNPFISQDFRGFLAVMNAEDLALLANLKAQNKLRSIIDRRYPLSETADAVAYSESGRARGKIILQP